MAGLVVGGVTIPVAVSGLSRSLAEVVDRGRALDNTYRVSIAGESARDWAFSTPPIARAQADIYELTLKTVTPQLCSGDLIPVPTLCCAEITGWTPVRLGTGHAVVMDFALHEVEPIRSLLEYAPGDLITSEAFTRSTTAYQINVSGVPVSIAINTKRDGHYVGGVRHTLLEATATNLVLRGNDFSHAAWTKTTLTVGLGIADPALGTDACTLTATGANSLATQNPSAGSSIVRTSSMWIRRRTGTGAIALVTPDGGNTAPLAITGTWARFSGQGVASVNRYCGVQIATSGDAVDVWCPQTDDFSFPTSEMPTTTASVTRGADSYNFPAPVPGPLTGYVKFVEKGTARLDARIYQVSNAAGAAPRLIGFASGGKFAAFHENASSTVQSTQSGAPALNDSVEYMSRLYANGSVDSVQSLNGAAATVSTQSAALAIASAWSGALLWLNAAGTAGDNGFTAIASFKIAAGTRSIEEMRAL